MTTIHIYHINHPDVCIHCTAITGFGCDRCKSQQVCDNCLDKDRICPVCLHPEATIVEHLQNGSTITHEAEYCDECDELIDPRVGIFEADNSELCFGCYECFALAVMNEC